MRKRMTILRNRRASGPGLAWTIHKFCALLFLVAGSAAGAADPSIRDVLLGRDFPAAIKSKNGIARWDQIDQVLNRKVLPQLARVPQALRGAEAETPSREG